jgi:hypothetical protein
MKRLIAAFALLLNPRSRRWLKISLLAAQRIFAAVTGAPMMGSTSIKIIVSSLVSPS